MSSSPEYLLETTICRALGKSAQARQRILRVLDVVSPGRGFLPEGEMRGLMMELGTAMTELYLAAASVDHAYELVNRLISNARDIRQRAPGDGV